MKSIGEVSRRASKAYHRIIDMIEADDRSNLERSKRLKRAQDKLEAILDGIECARDY
jgi:hypothetical protein